MYYCTLCMSLSFLLSSSPERTKADYWSRDRDNSWQITISEQSTNTQKNINIPEMGIMIRRDWCQSWKSRSRMVEVRCRLLVLKHFRCCEKYGSKMGDVCVVYIFVLYNQQSLKMKVWVRNGWIKGNQSHLKPNIVRFQQIWSKCQNEVRKEGQRGGELV